MPWMSPGSGDDNGLAEDTVGPDECWPDVGPHSHTVLVTGVVSHMDVWSELSLLIFKTVAGTLEILKDISWS